MGVDIPSELNKKRHFGGKNELVSNSIKKPKIVQNHVNRASKTLFLPSAAPRLKTLKPPVLGEKRAVTAAIMC